MIGETRTTIPTVDPMTRRSMDMRCEELRKAQFAYSAGFLAGGRADFRYPFAGYATEEEYLGSPPDPYPEETR